MWDYCSLCVGDPSPVPLHSSSQLWHRKSCTWRVNRNPYSGGLLKHIISIPQHYFYCISWSYYPLESHFVAKLQHPVWGWSIDEMKGAVGTTSNIAHVRNNLSPGECWLVGVGDVGLKRGHCNNLKTDTLQHLPVPVAVYDFVRQTALMSIIKTMFDSVYWFLYNHNYACTHQVMIYESDGVIIIIILHFSHWFVAFLAMIVLPLSLTATLYLHALSPDQTPLSKWSIIIIPCKFSPLKWIVIPLDLVYSDQSCRLQT